MIECRVFRASVELIKPSALTPKVRNVIIYHYKTCPHCQEWYDRRYPKGTKPSDPEESKRLCQEQDAWVKQQVAKGAKRG